MSIWSKVGIQNKGKYLFYTVGDDSAVLLAVKRKKKQEMIVFPKKIGKYTVRGIASLHFKTNALMRTDIPQKLITKLNDVLWSHRYSDFCDFKNYTLPETVEYVGVLPKRWYKYSTEKIRQRFELPKNVSYVENCELSTRTLVLPKDIKYIGKVTDPDILENIYTGNESCDEGVPHYSLARYRGEKEEDGLSHPKIAEEAFRNHSRLRSIILPDGIREIEELAFSGMRTIERFQFPQSLEKMAEDAIRAELTGTFRYPSNFPAGLEKDNYNFKITGKIVLEDMAHLEDMMQGKNARGESFTDFASEIDLSSVSGKIPDRAFYKEKIRSSFKIPRIFLSDNITEIGESAFEGNPITSLRLPENLRIIGKNAFRGCPYLEELMLPGNLEIVEEGAFNTKCELRLAVSVGSYERIKEQKGYLEHLERIEAPRRKANEFIEKYKDYFAGKTTKYVPPVRELIDSWSNFGRNPKIYEKLISRLKVTEVGKYTFENLIHQAESFGLNSEAEGFKKVLEEKVAKLAQSNRPSDWLSLYRFDCYNSEAVYKIVEYLLMQYETGAPSRLLWYIDVFMNLYGKNPRFSELDALYAKRVGNRGYKDRYWELRKDPEIKLIRVLYALDHGLIDACKKACDENSPYAYFWRDLAVAFSPDFKPPKCPPKHNVEKAKPQKNVSAPNKTNITQSFNSDINFLNTDTTYTYSGTSSFRYTEEERERAQKIISDYNAQKDAETYVAYLLDDIDAPSDLGSLVDEFSGIDWSEYGDV